MSILYLMVPLALVMGGIFLWAFIWGANGGQFDDLETPSHRILIPDVNEGENKHV